MSVIFPGLSYIQMYRKDGAKTAQNMVYKTSTAAEVRACAEVKKIGIGIVVTHI